MTALQTQGIISRNPHLLWKRAAVERRFKKRHAFALEADQYYVAGLCLDKTCEVLDIRRAIVISRCRPASYVDKRHVAMTVAYELSALSTIKLGKLFERNHSMILHAQDRVNNDKPLRAMADKVRRAVLKELKRRK